MTLIEYTKCEQCDFKFGYEERDFLREKTNLHQTNFVCRRCGYRESWEWLEGENGDEMGSTQEERLGYGAAWAVRPRAGTTTIYALHSEEAVAQAIQRMREGIAKGELDGKASYLTRWNDETHEPHVVLGKWFEVPKKGKRRNPPAELDGMKFLIWSPMKDGGQARSTSTLTFGTKTIGEILEG